MHSNPALRVVDRPQPRAFGPRRDDLAQPEATTGSLPSTALAEELWTEHGWSLSAQHVAILLIAVFAASVYLRLLS